MGKGTGCERRYDKMMQGRARQSKQERWKRREREGEGEGEKEIRDAQHSTKCV
jgi:hypothetical protein